MGDEQKIEGLPPRKQKKNKKKKQANHVSSVSFVATTFLYIIGSIILFSSIYNIVRQGNLLPQTYGIYILLLLLTVVFFVFFGTQFTLHYLYKTLFFERNKNKVLFAIMTWMLLIPIQIYGLFFISLTSFGMFYFSIISTFIIVQFIYSSIIYIIFIFTPILFPGTSQKAAN